MKREENLMPVPEWATDPLIWVCEALVELDRVGLPEDGLVELNRICLEVKKNKN